MSSLRDWAETLLFGDQLAHKLLPPPDIVDGAPWPAARIPRWPARPASLALGRAKAPSLRSTDVQRPGVACRALHTFVHHELQALELMAVALLRFHEAPAGFRRSLAVTMADEQRHLVAYRDRLESLGGHLGEHPASSFFWEVLHQVQSPAAFCAGMGLGFEQANLDFSAEWRDAFAAAGDAVTARVLSEVHADEVRHVASGRVWFGRLAAPGRSLFERWRVHLPPPMTPERARGHRFDREARRQAGLSQAFIRQLTVTRASRGPRPRVWWFVPGVEDELAGRTSTTLAGELGAVPALAAARGDVVVAARPPVAVLEAWDRAGLVVPEFVAEPEGLVGRDLAALQPWGWTAPVVARLAPLGVPSPEPMPVLSTRAWAQGLRHALGIAHGRVCRTLDEVLDAVDALEGPWVVKADLCAAGRHRRMGRGAVVAADHPWIRGTLSAGPVLVEPWLDAVVDVSVQIQIDAQGPSVVGITRFGSHRGVFRGVVLGPWTRGLSPELLRFAHGDGGRHPPVASVLTETALVVGRRAHDRGYRGPLGVDALIWRRGSELKLLPLLEINPRWTMGRVALGLTAQLAPQSSGAWCMVAAHTVTRAAGDSGAWVRGLAARWPHALDGRRRLVSGAVPTSDPDARGLVSWFTVAPRWSVHEQRWAEVLDDLDGDRPAALRNATGWISISPTCR